MAGARRGAPEGAAELIAISPLALVLLKARATLAQGWTQNAVARDARGIALMRSDDPMAVMWCSCGAIGLHSQELYEDACNLFGSDDILIRLNDAVWMTQARILTHFDKALQRLGRREAREAQDR